MDQQLNENMREVTFNIKGALSFLTFQYRGMHGSFPSLGLAHSLKSALSTKTGDDEKEPSSLSSFLSHFSFIRKSKWKSRQGQC